MATETKRVTCPVTGYTALSAGQANVSFKSQRNSTGRLAIAASLPVAGTADYVSIDSDQWTTLGSLGASDNVYYRPDANQDGDVIIDVIRG